MQISSPFAHQAPSVGQVMRDVLYALLPGIAVYVWLFGWAVILHLALASAAALACEALMLWLRGRPLRPALQDGSALVTAWLLALAITPLAPWWATVTGIGFALVFAKHLYGGLGYNPFNPAMVGYAALLVSFPAEMSRWPVAAQPLGLAEAVHVIFGSLPAGGFDAISSATPLDFLKTHLRQAKTVEQILDSQEWLLAFSGKIALDLAYLAGGAWLLYRRVITWHIPAAVLGTLILLSSLFYLGNDHAYPPPWFHLFSGAAMLGALFIATDPVSAATSRYGKLIYGAGIGILIYVIRAWGGYPDGVAFAVLLMNLSAPAIDYYTRPRVFGR
jgi:electron transport complex protein RnfD